MRARIGLLLVLLAALVWAPGAQAQSGAIQQAAQALRTDNVYVAPDAEAKVSSSDAARIRKEISSRHAGPMYVAILPDAAKQQAGGDVRGVLEALRQALGRQGTYVVVAGNSFDADSTTVAGANEAAGEVFNDHKAEGLMPTLLAYVDRIGEMESGSGGSGGGSGGSGGSGGGVGIAVVILALLIGGAFFLTRRRRRREEDTEFAEVKANTRDDLVALGEDIQALDLDVQMPKVDAQAREYYGQAVNAYDRANTAWERARDPADLQPVGSALEEGRWAMAAAKARLEGRPVPERRPPCFFDPRHGPSSRDVEWAPPGGAPRPVPACEADAQRVERWEGPPSREVAVGGRMLPYWNAGPMYAPWAGGFFGGYGGGLFPGLVMGTLLGEAISAPMAWGGGWGDPGGWGYAGGGDWGGGDWGGGDFGGGDFGGGDFGGGDFGGGDFGGGDF